MNNKKNPGCGLAVGFIILGYFASFFLMEMSNVGMGIILSIAICAILYIAYQALSAKG